MVSLDDYITTRDELILPPNTHKFKHRILIRGDPKDPTKVITGIPVIHNVSNQLVAFVELKREKNRYLPS
jgi:hypothetical protein